MSKLLSCFWKSKNGNDYRDLPQEKTGRGSRRLSRENDEVIYVETGAFVDKGAENQHRFNRNITNVYRTENISQTPHYKNTFGPDGNRQSRSYPVSPERRSLYKVYSFEQRPSIEKRRQQVSRQDSRDSKNLTVYAADMNAVLPRFGKTTRCSDDSFPFDISVDNVPRRSTLSHGVDYEKELLMSKGSPRCVAEKPAEQYNSGTPEPVPKPVLPKLGIDNDKNVQENERNSSLRRLKVDNKIYSPRSSIMGSENVVYLATDNLATEPMTKTVVRARPRSSKNFVLGSAVKPMIYRADDVYHPPMSTGKYIHQMPIKPNKHPHLLTTPDGKILKPLTSDNARRLSSSSSKGNQPRKLSIIRSLEPVEGFPLAHGGEVLVAAPMIGGGGGAKRGGKPQKSKSILRKGGGGKGGNAPYRGAPQGMDDYDDYPNEAEYGRGGYGQPYYDDGSDGYSFAPMDDPYSYGPRGGGGYYDDGYDGYGYPDEDMGRYGRGPGYGRGGRPARQQIYAAQMPDMTLPGTSTDKGKNPPFKKIGKPSEAPETCIDKDYYESKNEKSEPENKEQFPKVHKIKMISSAQQTDLGNELDFICFSPDRCYKTSEAPDDPNSKLRWRIIIKRGDEE